MFTLSVAHEQWPLASKFTISRGSKTQADVVVASVTDGSHTGRGECTPYARYGESIASVIEAIESQREALRNNLSRQDLQVAMAPGAARNALDCALWDLESKRAGARAWSLNNVDAIQTVTTAYTLSLDEPGAMRDAALRNAHRPLLKLKLGGPDDLDRVHAVRDGAPNAAIIVDANEGWTVEDYLRLAPELAALGVALIEQPLPAGADDALAGVERMVPVCADESCHDTSTLDAIVGKYDFINIKLDKTGGLTEALNLLQAARSADLGIMVGCMIATSLSMAPAMLVAQSAAFVDLDGPLLLASDRDEGLNFVGSQIDPPLPALWG